MKAGAALAQNLRQHLQREIKVHEAYIESLRKHRELIKKFKLKSIQELDRERMVLVAEMRIMHEKRLRLVAGLSDSGTKRLSTLISQNFKGKEKSSLLSLTDKLKELITLERKLSTDSNHVVNFALNLVNGSLSLIWQATQSVTRSYGRKGDLKERSSLGEKRRSGVLKQA